MRLPARFAALWENTRTSLWLVPALMAGAAVAGAWLGSSRLQRGRTLTWMRCQALFM